MQHSPKPSKKLVKQNDLPFKKRTLSIAVAGDQQREKAKLNRGNLDNLFGESEDNIERDR